ncbi:unnamed protein product [Macrosiphum euphorbiae]|uniref:BED-type domain-containing protein n=1 Tax=Macrosiphum euphorbiae TaxID=13131 RepID=A0AAV0WTI9_9HEMI|nr:unnamed protein product [Macrosiphum euphorbiae]
MNRKTSAIWDYFTIVENDKAKCNFCKIVLKFNQSSTTNLLRHIRSKHVTIDLSKRRRPNDDVDEEHIDDPSPMSIQNPSTSISLDRECLLFTSQHVVNNNRFAISTGNKNDR